MRWSYGVTTVPQRLDDLLPRTLHSLAIAGFGQPRLFIDGVRDDTDYRRFDLEVTTRFPTIRTYGNWILSLWELYIRMPNAGMFAIFQDDLVTYHNLRLYLEQCKYPDKGYMNLYTFPHNLQKAGGQRGWFLTDQKGKGGVGLVFSGEAVLALLGTKNMSERVQDASRGWRAVDGAVVTAMASVGWKEYAHNPSLVQHTGEISSMRNRVQQLADSFRGEDFDALSLL